MILVVESAAVYSVVMFLETVTAVVPAFTVVGSPMNEAQFYIDIVSTFVAVRSPVSRLYSLVFDCEA